MADVRRHRRTTPGPRRPRRCWATCPGGAARSSSAWCASGLSAPRLMAAPTKRRRMSRRGLDLVAAGGLVRADELQLVAHRGGVARQGLAVRGRARRRPRGRAAGARSWIALTMGGAYRWRSPSARKRAQPGSGSLTPGPSVGAAASRAQLTAPRGAAKPTVPGHAGAAGKQRCDDLRLELEDLEQLAAEVGRGGADAHPREHLAQPGLEAPRSRLTIGSLGVTSSAPRVPASSAASSMASHGTTALAPDASVIAAVWTSRTSAASTTMSVWPRRPASVSAAWTAPAASTEPTGSRPSRRPPRRSRMTSSTPRSRPRARLGRRALDREPRAPLAPARGPGRVEGPTPPSPADRRRRRDRPRTSAEATAGRPRTGTARRRVRPCGGSGASSGAAAPQVDREVHDDALALGVDGRVGDLREAGAGGRPPAGPSRGAGQSACRRPCSTSARVPRGPWS